MHPKLYPCSFFLNQSTISSGQQLGSHHLTDSSHFLSIPINHYFISILYPQYPSNSSTFLHLHYHHPNKSSSSLAYARASASCLRSPGSLLFPSNLFFTDDVCQIHRVNHVTPQIEMLQRFLITFRLKGENYTTYEDIRGDFPHFCFFSLTVNLSSIHFAPGKELFFQFLELAVLSTSGSQIIYFLFF